MWLRRSSPLVLVLACACAGSAPAPPPEPTPPPATAGPEPVVIERAPVQLAEAEVRAIAELLMLEDRRTLEPARMTELVRHWSPEVRRRAALAVGRIGDRQGTPLLLEAMRDSSAAVVLDALFAVGEMGDTASAVTRALEANLAEHPTDSLGVESVNALGKLGTAGAFAALSGVLRAASASRSGIVEQEALLALWQFAQVRTSADLVAPYLRSTDAETRWRAAYALVRPGVAAAIPLLYPLLEDPEPEVRALVVRIMRAATADSAGQRDSARAAVGTALRDPAPHVRINALAALATYSDAALAPRALPLLDDPDHNVRLAAAQALGALGGAAAAAALAATATDGTQKLGVRAASLTSLVAVDSVAGLRVAGQWASSERWLERLFGARALANLPWAATRDRVSRLARDPDSRVARAAFAAVARNADTTAAAYTLYLEGLRARSAVVRAAAIGGLGRRRSAANFAALMDAYDQARTDPDNAAAIAAIDALGELRALGVPVENAFFARFPGTTDLAVYRRVERRFNRTWDAPPPREERGAAFYEDIVRTYVAPELAGRQPPHVEIRTESGAIDLRMAAADAPLTVHNMISLIESGYYDNGGDPDARRWHRVVPNFVLQDGDSRGDGSGNPGYSIRDEINRRRYVRGVLGMALSGPDTGGSQFFITHSPQPHLDGGYTIFGAVVNGIDAADAVVQEDRIVGMRVIRP